MQFEDSKQIAVSHAKEDTKQVALINEDNSPYKPGKLQAAIAAESNNDGNIYLLLSQKAGIVSKQITELQTKQVTDTITEMVSEQVTVYNTKTLYRTVTSYQDPSPLDRLRGLPGRTITKQVPYTFQEAVVKTVEKPVERQVTRDVTVEATRDVNEHVEAGFFLQRFDPKGTLSGAPIALAKGAQATYDAELLFNLDLNNDNVQGRNTSLFDETNFHNTNQLSAFKQSSNTDLHRDLNSGELLTSPNGKLTPKTKLINKDGSAFLPTASQNIVAAEKDADGNLQLLSWQKAGELTRMVTEQQTKQITELQTKQVTDTITEMVSEQVTDYITKTLYKTVTSYQDPTPLERLRGLPGRAVTKQVPYTVQEAVVKTVEKPVERQITRDVTVEVTRDITVDVQKEVTEQVDAGFLVQSFDANGNALNQSTRLDQASNSTYNAELLFNLDLNNDNVQGRNTSLFDETNFHNTNQLSAFKQSSNTDLHRDLNSGELLTSPNGKLTPKTKLINKDGSAFLPTASQNIVAAEKDADGNLQLLSWQKAGELTRMVTEQQTKQITELQTKQVTDTITEMVSEQVTDYITKTLYKTVTSYQDPTPLERLRGLPGRAVTKQVPYTVQEAVVKTVEKPVERQITRDVTVEVTRDITVDVQKEVTEQVDAGFLVQSFDANGNALNQSTRLDQASNSTYNAELLFNLDLNNDNVQGRNTSLFDETNFHNTNQLSAFKQSSNTDLHRDLNSGELLTSPNGKLTPKTKLINKDGSAFLPTASQNIVAAEKDADGNLQLLSWQKAGELTRMVTEQQTKQITELQTKQVTDTITEMVSEQVTDYITKTLYKTVTSYQDPTPLERLRGLPGRAVTKQVPYTVQEAVVKTVEKPVERQITRDVTVEVTRDITVDVQKEVTEQVDAGFLVQSFDANGNALNQSTRLDQASNSTYNAELLFNLDLNNDNVQGRNTSLFDETNFHNTNQLSAFKQSSNTDLHRDLNSGELLTSPNGKLTPKTKLINKDGSAFLPTASQNIVAAEKDADGNLQLLSWQKAGELTRMVTEQQTKQITELQTKQVTDTITEMVSEQVTDYITKTLYKTVTSYQDPTPLERLRGLPGRAVTKQVPYTVQEAVVKTVEKPVERQITRDVTVEVTRDITVDVQKEVTEQVDAGFLVQSFDANGNALNQSTRLDQASNSTYNAELLFNLDLNNDNVQGRNTSLFDETNFHNTNQLSAFKQSSNTDLHRDLNSGELLTSPNGKLTPKTKLINKDGSAFLPTASQNIVAAEKDADGNLQLLSWQKAGELTRMVTEQQTKQITELQTKQVTDTITEMVSEQVTDYITKTLYKTVTSYQDPTPLERLRGLPGRAVTKQVPYTVQEAVVKTVEKPVERQITRDVTVEVTRDITVDVQKEVTEQVDAGFLVQSFDANGNALNQSTRLDQASNSTYNAELLFNLDLNNDNVQGRNIHQSNESSFVAQNKQADAITAHGQSANQEELALTNNPADSITNPGSQAPDASASVNPASLSLEAKNITESTSVDMQAIASAQSTGVQSSDPNSLIGITPSDSAGTDNFNRPLPEEQHNSFI